jgi:hypothetical protein
MDSMRIAVVRQCNEKDIDPDRPKSEQKICLYTKDGKRLLGRHPDKQSAYKQEAAIKARGGSFRLAEEGQGIPETAVPLPALEEKKDVPARFLAGILFLCQGRILIAHKSQETLSYWYSPIGLVLKDAHGMHRHLWTAAKKKAISVWGSLPPGLLKAARRHFYLNKKENKVYLTFVCELPPSALKWSPLLGPDADAYMWATKDDAEELTMSPTTKRVLENGDVWEGKSFSPINLVMEREATLGDLVQEGANNFKKVNEIARAVFSRMAKDFRFTRLEMVVVANSQKIPRAGVSGVIHREDSAERELYFDVSIGILGDIVKISVSLKKVGQTKKGSASTPAQVTQIPSWVISQLEQYGV